jgi:hypothetical protein
LFAEKAINVFCEKQGNKLVGLQQGEIGSIDLKETCEKRKPLDLRLLDLAETLAT